jgi:hypothetical protein
VHEGPARLPPFLPNLARDRSDLRKLCH